MTGSGEARGWRGSLMGGMFYLYLFLVSLPIFINISRDGVHFVSSVMKLPTGATINVGLLVIPWFVVALLQRCWKGHGLKTGALGKAILLFLAGCLAVVLCGQAQEVLAMRWLILGQVAAPFFAYFYLVNFLEDIRLGLLTKLLVASLVVQTAFFLSMNLQGLLAGQSLDASMFFVFQGTKIYLYGVRDYYPILFLTLVIFVHHNAVNKVRSGLFGQAAVLSAVLLYGFSTIFHSRSLLLALLCVFGFYLSMRSRQKPFVLFFTLMSVLLMAALILRPSLFADVSSSSRLLETIQGANAALQGQEDAFDAGGSTYQRLEAMTNSVSLFLENPLTGIAFAWPYAAHSQYLSMLAMGGIIPFALFLYLLWRLYYETRCALGRSGEGVVPAYDPGGACAILILFLVSAFFQNNLTVTYTSCLFWALVGMHEVGQIECNPRLRGQV